MEISIFNNMTDRQPITGRLADVAAYIRSDERLRAYTESYRQTGNKSFKTESPLFAVACRFSGGKSRTDVRGLTGLSLVDIDHAGDVEAMRRRAVADRHTVMCYVTMSGKGLRVIFRYTLPDAAEGADPTAQAKAEAYYRQAFAAGNAYYAALLGAEADLQCKNVTRLSTMAYDPGVFYRTPDEADPFTDAEITATLDGLAQQNREARVMKRIQTFYDTVVAPRLAKEGIEYAPGSHNNYVMRVGYRLAERRFSRAAAIRWCVGTFADYADTAQVVGSCFDNVTSRTGQQGDTSRTGDRPWIGVDEIKAFLDRRIELRYNVITGRAEYRMKPLAGTESEAEASTEALTETGVGALTETGSKQKSKTNSDSEAETAPWQPVSDRTVNTLWSEMSAAARVSAQDVFRVIESDYVPSYNPFRAYLDSLPADDGTDHIRRLADTVRVKGGEAEQEQWYQYLRKWLVAMVASWLTDDVVNNVILVLIGQQGAYKTTWFNYLLPPQLKQYFYTKTNANRMGRDDLLTLAQYGLVCCEELDTMRPAELNQLKAAVTMTSIDERAAYAHFHEHRKHIASFCGTGNNVSFLSDPTGNRRWLPFEVESIVSPREHPFCYAGIYAEAVHLYRSGFVYWFTREEVQALNRRNRQFETPRLEQELVDLYFRRPVEPEHGEFVSVAHALQTISYGISQKLSSVNVGRAFSELGFKAVRTSRCRGFLAICRTGDEIKAYQKRQALDSQLDTPGASTPIGQNPTPPQV